MGFLLQQMSRKRLAAAIVEARSTVPSFWRTLERSASTVRTLRCIVEAICRLVASHQIREHLALPISQNDRIAHGARSDETHRDRG